MPEKDKVAPIIVPSLTLLFCWNASRDTQDRFLRANISAWHDPEGPAGTKQRSTLLKSCLILNDSQAPLTQQHLGSPWKPQPSDRPSSTLLRIKGAVRMLTRPRNPSDNRLLMSPNSGTRKQEQGGTVVPLLHFLKFRGGPSAQGGEIWNLEKKLQGSPWVVTDALHDLEPHRFSERSF